jgi:hypothetical protein
VWHCQCTACVVSALLAQLTIGKCCWSSVNKRTRNTPLQEPPASGPGGLGGQEGQKRPTGRSGCSPELNAARATKKPLHRPLRTGHRAVVHHIWVVIWVDIANKF